MVIKYNGHCQSKYTALSGLDRLLPKSLFAWSKTFFDPAGRDSLQSRLVGIQSRYPAGLARNVLMTAQRDFRLGNSVYCPPGADCPPQS